MTTEAVLESTRESLIRIQQFDARTLSREGDLGQLNFAEAVQPAEALIGIYKRIPETALADFSDTQLNTINGQAGADYNLFKQILDFNLGVSDPTTVRNGLLASIKARRDALFDQLWQYIAYGVARSIDTSLMETEARATIQSIKDQGEKLATQLDSAKNEADEALKAIRAVASERGVSQQAAYFKTEAEEQEKLASEWLKYTYCFATAVGVFAILSLALHKVPWFKPQDNAEMLQLVTSKFLIFAVLAYMLLMAVRNYTSHKHNAVVNRHRRNALSTYQVLVEASGDTGTRDIVLAHASSCIFSPQETGFTQGKGESSSGGKSILEILTKSAPRVGE